MVSSNERIREFVEDHICDLPPGRRVHVVMVQRFVESKISIIPPLHVITEKLDEMSQGEFPEVIDTGFGWYLKMGVELNDIQTDAGRTSVL